MAATYHSFQEEEKEKEKEKKKKKIKKSQDEEGNNHEVDEEQLGYIRDEVEDDAWIEKLVQDEEKLQAYHDKIPSPIVFSSYINMIVAVLIVIIVNIVQIIVVVIYVDQYSEASATIVLSGMRPPTLGQIQYLLLRVFMNFECIKTLHPINFPLVTQPMWNDDSHVSTDRKMILSIAEKTSKYFQKLHMHVHYGYNQKYTYLEDKELNEIQTTRLSQKENSRLLFSLSDCYLTSTPCDQAIPKRIFDLNPPFYGLSSFIARLRLYIAQLKETDPTFLTEKTEDIRFIATSIRYDLREGVDQLTVSITDEGNGLISESVTIIIIVMVIQFVLIIGSMTINTIPWARNMSKESDRSLRLLDLIPNEESEKDMILLPSMRTGYKMDTLRERIMEDGQQLIEGIRRDEEMQTMIQQYNELMAATYHSFQEEEKDMQERQYNKEKMKEHIQMHTLLRQRLTILGDHLKSPPKGHVESIRSTVRRTLARLFDKHFIELDQAYVEEAVPAEERLGKTIGQEGEEGKEINHETASRQGQQQLHDG
ncbi:MAG: hypothetical protein EZS28_037347 [Streblomastix strix]|uniref:Uncharacterized protein n=1 Tax=Streblomastix strix TaxID=222440 RepID=A0A5J4U8B9_9EUKA|nr:MAG: hypothetical protein EZS28_037347 [Streblomastix strix]